MFLFAPSGVHLYIEGSLLLGRVKEVAFLHNVTFASFFFLEKDIFSHNYLQWHLRCFYFTLFFILKSETNHSLDTFLKSK